MSDQAPRVVQTRCFSHLVHLVYQHLTHQDPYVQAIIQHSEDLIRISQLNTVEDSDSDSEIPALESLENEEDSDGEIPALESLENEEDLTDAKVNVSFDTWKSIEGDAWLAAVVYEE
ncbi:hypothetical protein GALMADRAFT_208720 [Galerina marginata CBS 339.88]|uniref:Uncharacterized protein n=1 Tax=Galerina marginata (strain CBS 339.88) TaxID=685588 RepID=A0A067THA3_GALM3|nr:hypothetical protein GALMADRAFT_208720 [Galerina marginata CBS 339.88]